jgi:hypothetical protein
MPLRLISAQPAVLNRYFVLDPLGSNDQGPTATTGSKSESSATKSGLTAKLKTEKA